MLILYWLQWYKFDPELPSAPDTPAVAVESNIYFFWFGLVWFVKAEPLLCRVSSCQAQSQGRLRVPRWRETPPEGHTKCCSPRFCTHQVSWHISDLPAARSSPLGLPPPHLLMQCFPLSSVWAPSLSVSLQSCPLLSLPCSSFHVFNLLSSFLIWEENHGGYQLFTFEDSGEKRCVKALCGRCLQVPDLCTTIGGAGAAALWNSCCDFSVLSFLQLSSFSPL